MFFYLEGDGVVVYHRENAHRYEWVQKNCFQMERLKNPYPTVCVKDLSTAMFNSVL